jgi:heterodisulfide reductase subunit C
MTTPAPAAARAYDLSFARWVYENVNGGDKLGLCMQCGACSGS